jgi:hypothetical protein
LFSLLALQVLVEQRENNMIGIEALVGIAGKVLDRVIPDEKQKAEAQLKLAELAQNGDLKEFELEVQDRDSARKRESDIAATGPWYSKMVTPLLALIVAGSWFAIQWFLLNHVVQTEMREIIIRVLGNLDAAFMLVMSYYFGASHKHS